MLDESISIEISAKEARALLITKYKPQKNPKNKICS